MAKGGRKRKRPGEPGERKLSTMVIHRTKDTMSLVASVEEYKAAVAAALAEKYAPMLEAGEEVLDWELALTLAARDVQVALGHLIELDDRVDDEELEVEEKRLERDRLIREELYPRAVTVRAAIDLAFGREEGGHIHRMKGRTRRRAAAFETQLKRMLGRLTNDRPLPTPKNPHSHVDRAGWVRMLLPGTRKLLELNRSIARGEKALDFLYLAKKTAMEAFDVTYGDALRYLRSRFRMAGLGAVAVKNLRPYYMRRRLSRLARQRRTARADAADAQPSAAAPAKETARVVVPKTVARWLEKRKLFGT